MKFQATLDKQKTFFKTGKTKNIKFRKSLLRLFKNVIQANETLLYAAIYKDLKKSEIETYSTELSFIYAEINYFLKNIKTLSRPKKTTTNLVNQVGSSEIYYEPLGNVLVIGAWNYPYQLSLLPIVGALAAGNTVILKPSEIAAHTALVMEEIINKNFDEEVLHVFQGGVEETTDILKMRFDKIFFTGSPQVGKIVYQAAAKHLTPVTLELGGKSPVIVTASANLKVAAKRIAWGKFLNAGQTCLAPDYLYIDKQVKEAFLEILKKQLKEINYCIDTEYYTKIINKKNFKRLTGLLRQDKIYYGGKINAERLYIQPTLLNDVSRKDAIMQEEIFGPLLPVLDYTNLKEAFEDIKEHEKPLSAYIFTDSREEKKEFKRELSFGGGCINDTVMHISNPNLPFGGVGNSGIGRYHGKYSFETFSHQKAILQKVTWGEPALKYPPYSELDKSIMKNII